MRWTRSRRGEYVLLAPLTRNRKGDHAAILEEARKEGFTRARVDGELLDLLEGAGLPKLFKSQYPHDRAGGRPPGRSGADVNGTERKDYEVRLINSVETAMRTSKGVLKVLLGEGGSSPVEGEELLLSQTNACPHCEITLPALTPALFSFNAPTGMCPDCNGLGTKMEVDPDLIVEHPDISILDGASRWFGNLRKKPTWHIHHIQAMAAHYGADLELAWKDLPEKFSHALLYGSDGEKIQI